MITFLVCGAEDYNSTLLNGYEYLQEKKAATR